MARLGSAFLDGAPLVGRLVALSPEGAPGGYRRALRGDVAPRTVPGVEGIQSSPLEGLDLVAEADWAGPVLAEAGCNRLSLNHNDHG